MELVLFWLMTTTTFKPLPPAQIVLAVEAAAKAQSNPERKRILR